MTMIQRLINFYLYLDVAVGVLVAGADQGASTISLASVFPSDAASAKE